MDSKMTQPKALRLADELLEYVLRCSGSEHWEIINEAAAELRRLHEAEQELQSALKTVGKTLQAEMQKSQELLEALKEAADEIQDWGLYASEYFQNKHDLKGAINKARAAIAKHGGAA